MYTGIITLLSSRGSKLLSLSLESLSKRVSLSRERESLRETLSLRIPRIYLPRPCFSSIPEKGGTHVLVLRISVSSRYRVAIEKLAPQQNLSKALNAARLCVESTGVCTGPHAQICKGLQRVPCFYRNWCSRSGQIVSCGMLGMKMVSSLCEFAVIW